MIRALARAAVAAYRLARHERLMCTLGHHEWVTGRYVTYCARDCGATR